MSTQLTIPKLEMAMTEGTLTDWLVADGAQVKEGDPLYSLETGKSVQDIVAPKSGTLKVHAKAGEVYLVGHLIAEIK
jgi:pyruvate/2-oxoglutarate dehydrogenase complex dihydrolipoamide acyltransferase (E2) component